MKSDLFIYDFEKEKSTRLTVSQRLSEPQFSPGGDRIVCIYNSDGTHAIRVMDVDGKNSQTIFEGDKGTQFYAPQFSPDGSRILFGIFTRGTREIASIAAGGSDFRYELQTENDERDARWSTDGKSIVFASDRTGIFNLYRMSLQDRSVHQLTNVTGGAFAPDPSVKGSIVYSGYNGKGYNISVLDPHPQPVASMTAEDYAVRTAGEFDECTSVKGDLAHSSTDRAFAEGSMASAASGGGGATPQTDESIGGVRAPEDLESAKYKSSYTDFQIYPRVIIWDGVPRLGAFLATTEILEKQEIFVAGSYGTDGGYDFLVDFQMRHFFPVFYLQYFRMRQMYNDTVPIDDRFYFLDYRYDLWAADFGVRLEFEDRYSLISQHDLSFWFSHSEYRVHIDPEYVDLADPDAGKIPDQSAGWPYYRGNEFFAEYRAKSIRPALDSNINPRGGRQLRVRFMLAFDELFDTGEFEYGLNPKFGEYNFGQYQVEYQEYLALPWWRHSLQMRLYGSYIDNNVDDFFWIYMGGMDGLRGYTFYALGGRAGAMASAAYRFPILRRVNRQLSFLTIKDIYGAAFFEVGNAWDDEGFETSGYKRSAGYELRLNLGSFYAYPTAVQFVGAYAIDEAEYIDPLFEENSVLYDPQWRYYWTIGFFF